MGLARLIGLVEAATATGRETFVVTEDEFRAPKFKAFDGIEKAARPAAAAEFAVGHNRQAELLLHGDRHRVWLSSCTSRN